MFTAEKSCLLPSGRGKALLVLDVAKVQCTNIKCTASAGLMMHISITFGVSAHLKEFQFMN